MTFLNRLKIEAMRMHPKEGEEMDKEISYCVSTNSTSRKLKEHAMIKMRSYQELIAYAQMQDILAKSKPKTKTLNELDHEVVDSQFDYSSERRLDRPRENRFDYKRESRADYYPRESRSDHARDGRSSYSRAGPEHGDRRRAQKRRGSQERKGGKSNRDSQAENFPPCKHCGKKIHAPSECKFSSATCYICGGSGHISTICKSNSNCASGSSAPEKRARTEGTQKSDVMEVTRNEN